MTLSKFALLSVFMLTACSAQAETAEMPNSDVIAASEPCSLNLDFSNEQEVGQWVTVLDGVMGGRSSGVRFSEEEHMVFQGEIVTRGGGFSSVRRAMRAGTMSGARSLQLHLKSDGRAYELRFRTSSRYRGRTINYETEIPQTPLKEWVTVTVPLQNMRTSFRGFQVPGPAFDASDVREMGIILADGVDGPFRLEIAQIKCAMPA